MRGSKFAGLPREEPGFEEKPLPVVDVIGRTSVPPAVRNRDAVPMRDAGKPGVFGWKGLLDGAEPKPPIS